MLFLTKNNNRVCQNKHGDNMRFKIIVPIILAIVSGVLMTKFVFNQYDYSFDLKTVFDGNVSRAYFIEIGSYPTYEEMQMSAANLSSYIYEKIGDKYYVYVAITKSKENAKKIKEYFIKNGYNIYIKEIAIENELFFEKLYEYDTLLSNLNDEKAILTLCNQVLETYEELVTKNVHN